MLPQTLGRISSSLPISGHLQIVPYELHSGFLTVQSQHHEDEAGFLCSPLQQKSSTVEFLVWGFCLVII